jgi:RNAse (barnase) inhibitor barstar
MPFTNFMRKKTIIINGSNFSSLDSFYEEVENFFTKGLDWKIGRNLDAFNDVLRGGFGIFDSEEKIKLLWVNSIKSKLDLGFEETEKYLEKKLKTCHPANRESVKIDLELAKQQKGATLFEIIVEIIKAHDNIELSIS